MRHSPLFDVFSARTDGRLENVRTRHEGLRKMSLALQRRRTDLRDALQVFVNLSDESFDLHLHATLRNLALHAASLDQPQAVDQKKALAKASDWYTHHLIVPIGVVAIEVPEDANTLALPVDAIFGPVAAALAAGCCIVVVHHDKPETRLLLAVLAQLFGDALNQEAFALVASSQLSAKDWQQFGRIVRYSSISASAAKEVERPWNVLQIAARPKHVVIVDHSLVDDRCYRHPDKNPGLTRREAAKLEVIAETINSFPSEVSHIFVTETIMPLFQRAWADKGRGNNTIVSSVLSTQDTIYNVQEQGSGRQAEALNLYIFATPSTASFYANHIDAQAVSVNGLPKDLSVGCVPSTSSARLAKKSKHQTAQDFVLEPLWSPSLFSQANTAVLLHRKPKRDSTRLSQRPTLITAYSTIAPMKRGEPDHLDFFPTGFKITFFPLALSILGGLGYGGFKLAMLSYRFARSHH